MRVSILAHASGGGELLLRGGVLLESASVFSASFVPAFHAVYHTRRGETRRRVHTKNCRTSSQRDDARCFSLLVDLPTTYKWTSSLCLVHSCTNTRALYYRDPHSEKKGKKKHPRAKHASVRAFLGGAAATDDAPSTKCQIFPRLSSSEGPHMSWYNSSPPHHFYGPNNSSHPFPCAESFKHIDSHRNSQ